MRVVSPLPLFQLYQTEKFHIQSKCRSEQKLHYVDLLSNYMNYRLEKHKTNLKPFITLKPFTKSTSTWYIIFPVLYKNFVYKLYRRNSVYLASYQCAMTQHVLYIYLFELCCLYDSRETASRQMIINSNSAGNSIRHVAAVNNVR